MVLLQRISAFTPSNRVTMRTLRSPTFRLLSRRYYSSPRPVYFQTAVITNRNRALSTATLFLLLFPIFYTVASIRVASEEREHDKSKTTNVQIVEKSDIKEIPLPFPQMKVLRPDARHDINSPAYRFWASVITNDQARKEFEAIMLTFSSEIVVNRCLQTVQTVASPHNAYFRQEFYCAKHFVFCYQPLLDQHEYHQLRLFVDSESIGLGTKQVDASEAARVDRVYNPTITLKILNVFTRTLFQQVLVDLRKLRSTTLRRAGLASPDGPGEPSVSVIPSVTHSSVASQSSHNTSMVPDWLLAHAFWTQGIVKSIIEHVNDRYARPAKAAALQERRRLLAAERQRIPSPDTLTVAGYIVLLPKNGAGKIIVEANLTWNAKMNNFSKDGPNTVVIHIVHETPGVPRG